MSAPSVVVIRRGRERARTSRWRGAGDTAYLTPAPEAPYLSADFVRHCVATLGAKGFTRVITGALSPLEQTGFLAAGFDVEQRLRLLGMDLATARLDLPSGFPLKRVPRRRQAEVLEVDRAAFTEFWRFDELGLTDALRATPVAHFRMAVAPDRSVAGYAICGRSGHHGFVQRLAVHPRWQRHGAGTRLLFDGLNWMQHHGVTKAVVNTQTSNDTALALYLKAGFREEPVGLSVLSAGVP